MTNKEIDLKDIAKKITILLDAMDIKPDDNTKDSLHKKINDILSELHINQVEQLKHIIQEAEDTMDDEYWTDGAMELVQNFIKIWKDQKQQEEENKRKEELEDIRIKEVENKLINDIKNTNLEHIIHYSTDVDCYEAWWRHIIIKIKLYTLGLIKDYDEESLNIRELNGVLNKIKKEGVK